MTDIVYWKQKNGELISIDDMDIQHLRNVLKMIIRKNKEKLKRSSDINDYVEEYMGYRFHDDENRNVY
jgi:hypothetical protein